MFNVQCFLVSFVFLSQISVDVPVRPIPLERTHPIAVARGGDEGDTAPHISVHLTLCACVYCVECMTDRLAFNFR